MRLAAGLLLLTAACGGDSSYAPRAATIEMFGKPCSAAGDCGTLTCDPSRRCEMIGTLYDLECPAGSSAAAKPVGDILSGNVSFEYYCAASCGGGWAPCAWGMTCQNGLCFEL